MACPVHVQRTRIIGVAVMRPPLFDGRVSVLLPTSTDVAAGDVLVKPMMPEKIVRLLGFILDYPKGDVP